MISRSNGTALVLFKATGVQQEIPEDWIIGSGLSSASKRSVAYPLPRPLQIGHDGSAKAAAWLRAVEVASTWGTRTELLSPLGEPSTIPAHCRVGTLQDGVGKVFALLPDGRLITRLEEQSWGLEPKLIGTKREWIIHAWESQHLNSIQGDGTDVRAGTQGDLGSMGFDFSGGKPGCWWRDLYSWEYWRMLQPVSEERSHAVAGHLQHLDQAAKLGAPGTWWRSGPGAESAARMLDTQGFCVLDSFLPLHVAEALRCVAVDSWRGGCMNPARWVDGAAGGPRGDSIIWINVDDPRAAKQGSLHRPYPGQASAAVPELAPVLECLDAFVADVVAKQLTRGQVIATRSHGMLTCYPAEGDVPEEKWVRGHLRHIDNNDGNGQILTTILYLNKDWTSQDGGIIRLFESEPALQVRGEVLPQFNSVIAFWSEDIPHEVTPPARDRFAITTWYLDRAKGPSVVAFDRAPTVLK